MSIKRQPVTSSQIKSIGHDPQSNDMDVEFTTGAVYRYFEVPSKKYSALMTAASVGAHLNKHIKGQHRYSLVTPARNKVKS